MTCPMPRRAVASAPLPDFSKFGMTPRKGGRFIDVSAGGPDQVGHIKGLMLQYPNGRVGSLTISHNEGLDDYEQYRIDVLTDRCCQGSWALEGLKNCTPPGTYAATLVADAIAAGAMA